MAKVPFPGVMGRRVGSGGISNCEKGSLIEEELSNFLACRDATLMGPKNSFLSSFSHRSVGSFPVVGTILWTKHPQVNYRNCRH